MAIGLNLFSGSNFRLTIQDYCNQLDWTIREINDSKAILMFTADSGNTQTVFIIRYKETLEFSVPSGLDFPNLDDVPGRLSTLLLSDNATDRVGFWCIEDIGGRQTFSVMHNAEMSLIDLQYFGLVVLTLVKKCDDFEQRIQRALAG